MKQITRGVLKKLVQEEISRQRQIKEEGNVEIIIIPSYDRTNISKHNDNGASLLFAPSKD